MGESHTLRWMRQRLTRHVQGLRRLQFPGVLCGGQLGVRVTIQDVLGEVLTDGEGLAATAYRTRQQPARNGKSIDSIYKGSWQSQARVAGTQTCLPDASVRAS